MKYVIIFYVIPILIMLVYDVLGIRWHLKRNELIRPFCWPMVFRTLCPLINLVVAVCMLLLDFDYYMDKLLRKLKEKRYD